MKATLQYIQQRFDEFNRLMFAGRLPQLPIELSDASTFLGLFVCKIKHLPDGTTQHTDFRLRINTRIDLPQDTLDDVVIHEMIHYFIAYHGLTDTSAHGKIFRSLMESINANHGRHITISRRHATEQEKEQAINPKARWHVIALLELTDGSLGVKVLPRVMERIRTYVDAVSQANNVSMVKLYLHNNPFFNRYPTSGALKYHTIDLDTFNANIIGASRLELRASRLINLGPTK